MWQDHSLRISTKIQVYKAVVLSTLLYGSETWVLYWKRIKLLECFHQRCLRAILGIKWQGHTTNIEVLEKADLPNIEAMLMLRQLRWAGHVARMVDSRMPKFVFYGEVSYGKRSIGALCRRYKDQMKQQLAWMESITATGRR